MTNKEKLTGVKITKSRSKSKEDVSLSEYKSFLESIKKDIKQTQIKAAAGVNTELIMLYWRIGKAISEKVAAEGWGAKTIDSISNDLARAFPGMAGFSVRNLRYMRKFFETYSELNFAAAAAKLPWGHNMAILDALSNNDQRLWYIQQVLEHGWSRSVLTMWIASDLYGRQGKALTNFQSNLPKPQSDLAQQTLKDPYNLEFLMMSKDALEKEIEGGLMEHLQRFLVELGQGFAFVGKQYPLKVGTQDFFIDLLFYHLKLRCFVVVELKATAFDPRDTGQLSFYLAAVDNQLRSPEDKPTIGLLLCQSKDELVVEYALQQTKGPIGVADYMVKFVESLPRELKKSLPSVQEIEEELKIRKKTKSPKKQSSK